MIRAIQAVAVHIVLVMVQFLYLMSDFRSSPVWPAAGTIACVGCFLSATWLVASAVDTKPRVQLYRIQAVWLLMVFIAFGPFLETTAIEQVNTFALFFVLASVFLSEMEHPVLAGLALEIAILEKTSPILLPHSRALRVRASYRMRHVY